MEISDQTRVRMNFAQDAKGFVKRDITVEFPTVEEAEAAAIKAIASYKKICDASGLRILEVAP